MSPTASGGDVLGFWASQGTDIAGSTYAGFTRSFVGKYVDAITTSQINSLHAAGLTIFWIKEGGGSPGVIDMTYARGQADASIALSAMNGFGVPADRPCYFAIDFDAGPGNVNNVWQYFRGINSVMGVNRTGIYGSGYIMDQVRVAGFATWFWQGESTGWRNNSSIYPYAALRQIFPPVFYSGREVDNDVAYVNDFGQWPSPAASPAGPGGSNNAVAQGGNNNATISVTSSFTQSYEHSLISPAPSNDQVMFSITLTENVPAGNNSITISTKPSVNQVGYPVCMFSIDDGATWSEAGFGVANALNPLAVIVGCSSTGTITINTGNATGAPLTTIFSVALMCSYSPTLLARGPILLGQKYSYINTSKASPPYSKPYSSYRRIAKDSVVGAGSSTVPHGLSTIPNIGYWVSNSGNAQLVFNEWASDGADTAAGFGIKVDASSIYIFVNSAKHDNMYYRAYLDN